ncbi:MAG: EamA family transporter [Rhizobiaceae bacterium]|nr:EamA family transporter [Rhizobiaceae bacterium]
MTASESVATDSFTDIRRGLVLMVTGSFLIPGLDAAAKLLTERHDLSAGEIGLLRFLLQTLMVLPLLLATEGTAGLRIERPLLNLLRGVLLGLATFLFFTALKFMPLADATAIFFIEPMLVTILSVVFLKETVGWRRGVAILVGFAGAMIVIRPNFLALGPVAVLPALTAACVAVYAVLSRSLSKGSSPLAMHFYAGLGGLAALSVACAYGVATGVPDLALTMPEGPEAWVLILTLGVFATVCHLMFIHAYRLAPASLLAPFGYIEIISAVLLGFVLFGEFPDPAKWVGIAVIMGSGIYIAWRENLVVRRKTLLAIPEHP